MTTAEKVAYLKGLAEGLGIDASAKEGKLLNLITDILEDLALDQEDLADDIAELEDGLDAVSDDLEDVETILFGDEEDEEEDDDGEEIEDWDGETVFYEAVCPSCGETVTFDESILKHGSIQCPVCGASLEFNLEAGADAETPEE